MPERLNRVQVATPEGIVVISWAGRQELLERTRTTALASSTTVVWTFVPKLVFTTTSD